jgi:transposase-like protein
LHTDIRAIFNAPNGDEAKRQLDLFIDKYQTSMPKLTQWAEDNIPEGLSIFAV